MGRKEGFEGLELEREGQILGGESWDVLRVFFCRRKWEDLIEDEGEDWNGGRAGEVGVCVEFDEAEEGDFGGRQVAGHVGEGDERDGTAGMNVPSLNCWL